ncbi:MAG TPA: phage baseplate protein [Thermoanaerobaculia bacterium]|nr:phage baseplate protein [Thermoanaerobaculia bacterium]
MRTLPAWELLEVWDRGADQVPAERALALLAGACPEIPAEELAGLSLGRRDTLLLALRRYTFGPELAGVASCSGCSERLETAFRVEDVRAEPPDAGVGPYTLAADGWTVRFRLPNSVDSLALAASLLAVEPAREYLLDRCVLAAEREGAAATAAELPEEVVRALAARMEELDPMAEVRIVLGCPACGQRSEPIFDVLSFFWAEIAAWAERTLDEVHLFAAAYGWRETDTLALGPRRRQAYLRRVGA